MFQYKGLSLCNGCFREFSNGDSCSCDWERKHNLSAGLVLRPGVILRNEYRVGGALGVGGFGITYKALHLETGAFRAIKEYMPSVFANRVTGGNTVTTVGNSGRDLFEHGLRRFSEEAGVLARINHPSVVAVHEYFAENETAYFVMEYLGSVTLASYLDDHGDKLEPGVALELMMRVMDGLRQAHGFGLIHRDVSPDNICIDRGFVRLIDFGAARFAVGEKHPKSLTVVVKDGYSPIEQYSSTGVQGPFTDVYAVGATLYRSIVGKRAPSAASRFLNDKLLSPRSQGVDVSPRVERVILKAMSLRAADRYRSVAEMQEALDASLAADARASRSHQPRAAHLGSDTRSKSNARWVIALVVAAILAWIVILRIVAQASMTH